MQTSIQFSAKSILQGQTAFEKGQNGLIPNKWRKSDQINTHFMLVSNCFSVSWLCLRKSNIGKKTKRIDIMLQILYD